MNKYLVVIVNFGEDSTKKLARIFNILRINYAIVYPDEVPTFVPSHIILSGGPKHVYEPDHYHLPKWVINSSAPVLGICYGMQLIAHTFGGSVVRMKNIEKGPVEVTEIIDDKQVINYRWMHRHDQVVCLPPMFTITGVTSKNHIAAFTDYKKWWAVQYHPESNRHGSVSFLRKFLRDTYYSR